MWIYVVTSFTRYSKVGREARQAFQRVLQKDGFFRLHENLYVRHSSTHANALIHKKHIKDAIPESCCDISILLSSGGSEDNAFHSLNRKRTHKISYGRPKDVEFF
ncbi:MAG: hypothetical protein IJ901_04970 [Bacteroidaceae bacterium]|nr:hypothetical protein [Bacteroidaceae bacterium]